MVALSSCDLIGGGDDDDDKDGGDNNNQGCVLSGIDVMSSYDDGTFSDSYEESWTMTRKSGKITAIAVTYSSEYCEGTVCESDSGSDEVRFIYDGSNIIGFEIYEDGVLSDDSGDFVFENGRLVKRVYGVGSIDEYRYEYNSDGQLISEENWDNYSGPNPGEFVLYDKEEYEYQNGNMVKTTYYYNDFQGGRSEPKAPKHLKFRMLEKSRVSAIILDNVSDTYTYDNANNPFGKSAAWFLVLGDVAFNFSQNNVLTEVETYDYDGSVDSYTETYSYQYNDDNFPTSFEQTDDWGEVTNVQFSYDCN